MSDMNVREVTAMCSTTGTVGRRKFRPIVHWFLSILLLLLFTGIATTAGSDESSGRELANLLQAVGLPSKNYVQNADFSMPMEPRWHVFTNVTGGNFYGIANEGEDGGPCLKISGQFDDNLSIEQCWGAQDTALEVGETYTFSASFKAEGVKGINFDKLVCFIPYGGYRTSIAIGPSAGTTAGWERRSVTFTAPETLYPPDSYKYALFIRWLKGNSGTVWIDNVQIEKGDKLTAFTPQNNLAVKQLKDELQAAYADISKARNNIRDNFSSSSPLATALLERTSKTLQDVTALGKTFAAGYEKLSNARLAEMRGRLAALYADACQNTCPVWYKNPYIFSDEKDFPLDLNPPAVRKLVCYANETRNLGLIFTNLRGSSLNFRIAPQRFQTTAVQGEVDGASFVTVYEAPPIRGLLHKDRLFTDPLPLSNQMKEICVPGGESRQAILSINTEGLSPGQYQGNILLDCLTSAALAQKLDFEIEVLPVRLPDRVPVTVCAMGATSLRPEEARRLGNNCIFVDADSFSISLDNEGNLTQPQDFTYLDRLVKESREVVPNCKFLLIFSVGQVFLRTAESRYGYKWPEERLKKAWQNWVKEIFTHVQSLGVSLDDFYLQVMDEPQDAQVEMLAELSRLAKEAVPGLKTMTFGGDPRKHAKAFEYLNFFVPTSQALDVGGLAEVIKNNGFKAGIYDCNEYNEIIYPLTYQRLMPWKVWKYNLVGWFYWYRSDRFPTWDSVQYMSMIYPLAEKLFQRLLTPDMDYVISRHWLAMEAGYQDYKALYLLRQNLEQARRKGLEPAVIEAAAKTLNEAPEHAFAVNNPAKFPNELAPNADPDVFDTLRGELAAQTARLHERDPLRLEEEPSLNEEGVLAFKTDRPSHCVVQYTVDGQLPARRFEETQFTVKHRVLLNKYGGKSINRCRVQIIAEDGQVFSSSPFFDGKVTVDSTSGGYESACINDGFRYPGAQFWPGKTWISDSTSGEHWVQIEAQKPRKVSKVIICWMSRGGLPQDYKVQCRENETWRDLTDWRRAPSALDIVTFNPVNTAAIRILQKVNGGNVLSPKMIGISELEIY